LKEYSDAATLSGNPIIRFFCEKCGSSMFAMNKGNKDKIIVSTGTIDGVPSWKPRHEFYWQDRVTWLPEMPSDKKYNKQTPVRKGSESPSNL
jgi:hypothetical protein